MTVLVTGGAGYIGSHTAVALHEAGRQVVLLDNLRNASIEAVDAVRALTTDEMVFVEGDLLDAELVERVFSEHDIDEVVHFAAHKAVGESVADPLRYWDVNLNGSRVLAAAMERHGCRTLVFSSTATVYGEPDTFPLREEMPTAPVQPYAQTKLAVEQMLAALARSGGWRIASLRYFNPVSAHPSGRIGEDPLGIPNNLFPYITQVAAGRREKLRIFGQDYATEDGTGVRDYLHVMDLAEAHSVTLGYLLKQAETTHLSLNIGTGQGLSVLDVVHGFEAATGVTIPYEIVDRRPGDVAKLVACPKQAEAVLGWHATRSLEEMCRDGWAWQQANPMGYRAAP